MAGLKELFSARAAGSNVLLSCYGYTCRVFGASIPVSALPGEEARTFTAHLPDGQDRGLIAVAVNYTFNGKAVWSGYVLALTRGEDGCVYVNLDHPWVPEGAQIIQIDHLGIHLTDVVSGHRFTTAIDIVNRHNARHVSDGNLLVRCLAGLATVDEVRAAAIACVEEKLVREQLVELEARARIMEARIDDLGKGNERLREIERLARAIRRMVKGSPAALELLQPTTSYQELDGLLGADPQT